jgi:hypothetical protein
MDKLSKKQQRAIDKVVYENDPMLDASSIGDTQFTPRTDETVVGDVWDGHTYTVPWPNTTFIIVEHGTNRAITLTDDGVCLLPIKDGSTKGTNSNRWHCVEKQGYFGFYNPESRVYLGHNGGSNGVVAVARLQKGWELLTPRKHPDGGYQLLFPYYEHTLMMITVANPGGKLVRTHHGETRWDFIKA